MLIFKNGGGAGGYSEPPQMEQSWKKRREYCGKLKGGGKVKTRNLHFTLSLLTDRADFVTLCLY